MIPRQSVSAYRETLAPKNTATQTKTRANAFSPPGGGYVQTSSAYRSPGGRTITSGVETRYIEPLVEQTSVTPNAFTPPAGARITDGAGNSLTPVVPQNAYAQALAGGGALGNPFSQSYGYLQSLMSGSAYDVDSLRYTEPTGGYADTVQGNANKIVAPTAYNPVNAAQWNFDVPETVRMRSGVRPLSPAAEAYGGMIASVNADADLAMAKYWADIANTAQSENDRQYALRQALRYRNRILV